MLTLVLSSNIINIIYIITGIKMRNYIFILGFFCTITYTAVSQEIHRVVIDLRTGDINKFENSVLKGLSYVIQLYRDKLEDMKVVVIAHGDSYRFFLRELKNTPYESDKELVKRKKDIEERLKNLVKFYGVKFEICEAGMKARNIDVKNLYRFVKPIPTALNGIVEWQEKGYRYMLFE